LSRIISSTDAGTTGSPESMRSGGNGHSFFLELGRLLMRIESATTPYQILGVGRDVSRDDLGHAFGETLAILYPPYPVSAALPAEILTRVEQAFNKAAQAFSVLASFARRRDYDTALSSRATPAPAANAPPQAIRIQQAGAPRAAYNESAKSSVNNNRRRTDRLRLTLPVRVVGSDREDNGKWSEMAETLDVSRTGVRLRLGRSVRYGMVLYLSLPLPPKLRSHGFADAGYNVYALVRRIEPPKKGVRVVGLEFIGERPPPGYLEKPWATFRTRRWAGDDRRRARRIARTEAVRLEYISTDHPVTVREEAMTENVSRTGLRVIVRAAPQEFDRLRVTSTTRQFEGLAILRNRFVAADGIERLCLQFLDKDWPV
jgi:PilZ domain